LVSVVPTNASLLAGGVQDFTAAVANDPSAKGVTWTITGCAGGAALCGSLTNVTSTAATYSAPAPIPSDAQLRITAASVSDNTKSFTATVAITAIGTGGRIAFRSERDGNSEIYAMNVDGSGVVRLTNDGASDGGPAWSPDGMKVAFDRLDAPYVNTHQIYVINADGSQVTALIGGTDPAWSRDGTRIAAAGEFPVCGPRARICNGTAYRIMVINADGSGLVVLTSSGFDREPTWSPDGRIAFTNTFANGSDIFVMNADGTGLTNFTNDPASDDSPAWSPDGTKIAFRSNRNADGSGVIALTADSATEGRPAWSPDGTKIAYASDRDGDYEIYVMNADGSGVVRLTDNPAFDARPAWAP
jgi:Tol biopolymer transport system component